MISTFTMLWVLTVASTKRYLRDGVALFFTVVFPLIFLIIFGGIFGDQGGPNFSVAMLNSSSTDFSREFIEQTKESEIFTVEDATGFDDAQEKLGRGELDAIIEIPENFGELDELQRPSGQLKLLYDESDQQLSTAVIGVLSSVIDGINDQFIDVEPPLSLVAEPIQTANLSAFDYTLAGLIGFSILGLGIFSMANGFASDKKTGALRRMRVAPIQAWHIIISTALNRIIIGLLTVAVMFVVSLVLFDFNMRGDYLNFALFTVIGTVCMFGFGMAVAGWARNENQAAPISNLLAFPMMFLSGAFFPRFLMPEWLQSITDYIPLTPIVDGLRLILTEGQTVLDLGPQLLVIAGWSIVMYLIAFTTFRWE